VLEFGTMSVPRSERQQLRMMLALLLVTVSAAASEVSSSRKPPLSDKAASARWLVSESSWGVMASQSTLFPGFPFSNPVSLADVDGEPVFCVSPLDQSIQDLLAAPQMSLTQSEAALSGDDRPCDASSGGDPENPPCARLTLTGTFANVTDFDAAAAALRDRHPAMADWGCFDPDDNFNGHDFFLAKLTVDHAWLINIYGGAAVLTPDDYFNADRTLLNAPEQQDRE